MGSYVDLGSTKASGPAFGGFTDKLTAKGWDVSGLGMFPIHGRLGGFGLLGVFRWSQDVHYVETDATYGGVYDYSDSGTGLSMGAGLNYDLVPKVLGLHFAYRRFLNVGDPNNSGHENDRSFYSLGMAYRFGL